jgi:hypothetical protein
MSSVNPEFTIELAFDIIDVGDPVYAFSVMFAVRIRFLPQECNSEIAVCEFQLRRVGKALGGQYQLQNQCSLRISQSMLEDNVNVQFVLFVLCQCIEHLCNRIAAKTTEPRRGPLLRGGKVSGQAPNPFVVEFWLPFVHNFLTLSELRYREIRDAIQRAFCVYVRLFEIPDTFHEDLKTTIPWFSDIKIIGVILGSAVERVLLHFATVQSLAKQHCMQSQNNFLSQRISAVIWQSLHQCSHVIMPTRLLWTNCVLFLHSHSFISRRHRTPLDIARLNSSIIWFLFPGTPRCAAVRAVPSLSRRGERGSVSRFSHSVTTASREKRTSSPTRYPASVIDRH